MLRTLLLLLLATLLSHAEISGQKVLLLERAGQNKAERLIAGDLMTFRMNGDKFWQEGRLDDLRPDIQALVINDRFIMLDEIDALRFNGSGFLNYAGLSLLTFGAGWSAFALVGYATDGNPETSYGGLDLTVTLTSMGTGFLLRKLFAKRRFKLNERRRLRVVDLDF